MTWSAPVASVAADERGRRIATVALGADGGRYPSPGWWHSVEAYFVGSLDNKTGDPAATVYIGRQPFRLAGIPSDGRTLTVDVSKAKTPVTAADTVCLLCEQHTLYSMAEVRSLPALRGQGCGGLGCGLLARWRDGRQRRSAARAWPPATAAARNPLPPSLPLRLERRRWAPTTTISRCACGACRPLRGRSTTRRPASFEFDVWLPQRHFREH